MGREITQTHQFEFGLATGRNSDRLDAVLPRNAVMEHEERLMWLDASSFFLLGDLE